jgi:hypothetical protein
LAFAVPGDSFLGLDPARGDGCHVPHCPFCFLYHVREQEELHSVLFLPSSIPLTPLPLSILWTVAMSFKPSPHFWGSPLLTAASSLQDLSSSVTSSSTPSQPLWLHPCIQECCFSFSSNCWSLVLNLALLGPTFPEAHRAPSLPSSGLHSGTPFPKTAVRPGHTLTSIVLG